MDLFSLRILKSQPLRLMLTIGGIALCIILMLFLLAVYSGVEDGSVEYIRKNHADLWVLQRNAWNILRGSSILSTGHGVILRGVEGVESASPVLLLLSGIQKGNSVATVFLAGFDTDGLLGGPPSIVEGRTLRADNEIVLDKAFAAKLKFRVGDKVYIQDDTLTVAGLTTGTNALVIQYAFVSLKRAQALAGFPGIVTCYLVKVKNGAAITDVARNVREELPGLEVYDQTTFLRNNIREMETGFLPFLFIIAALGTVVLTVIVSLLLSINILERRKDFAILKTLGSPQGFLPRLVIEQALLISTAGSFVALLFFFPIVSGLQELLPELATKSSMWQLLLVVGGVWIVSLLSSLISMQRLRRIYPLEAFS